MTTLVRNARLLQAAKACVCVIAALALVVILRKLGLSITGVGFAASAVIDQEL